MGFHRVLNTFCGSGSGIQWRSPQATETIGVLVSQSRYHAIGTAPITVPIRPSSKSPIILIDVLLFVQTIHAMYFKPEWA